MSNTRPPLPSALAALRTNALTHWNTFGARERLLISVAASVIALWLLWSLALAPALLTLRQTPAQLEALDSQIQTMQRLAVEAKELRSVPAVPMAQALEALKSATARLGDKAKLTTQGDRSTLNLNGVSGEQLRAWLSEARMGARIKPIESQLTRGPKGYVGTLIVSTGGTP
jgi:general secretion pathway protein M